MMAYICMSFFFFFKIRSKMADWQPFCYLIFASVHTCPKFGQNPLSCSQVITVMKICYAWTATQNNASSTFGCRGIKIMALEKTNCTPFKVRKYKVNISAPVQITQPSLLKTRCQRVAKHGGKL